MKTIHEQAKRASEIAHSDHIISTEQKNAFLEHLATCITEKTHEILSANQQDLTAAESISKSMQKRLRISEKSIEGFVAMLHALRTSEDPVGKIISTHEPQPGLSIQRVTVPIGVIAIIFESRPNVLLEAAALCVKSGNTALLRGGKEAQHTNDALFLCIKNALRYADINPDFIQNIKDRRYEAIEELLTLDQYISLVIPRGSERLVDHVAQQARMPVMKHSRGLCHMYLHSTHDITKTIELVINAKTSNSATCNTIETLLIDKVFFTTFGKEVIQALLSAGVTIYGDEQVQNIDDKILPATPETWATEYLDEKISIKVTDSLEDTLSHILHYSSFLTDSIVSTNQDSIARFMSAIPSAVVLVNASNRLADGGVFGFGAEIGISTSPIHMRGPMGLTDLVVSRYIVTGDHHTRN